VSNSADVDREGFALAHQQARDVMRRCDELIQRVEKELSKFGLQLREDRPPVVTVARPIQGRFSFLSLDDVARHRPASNSNRRRVTKDSGTLTR
jgi:hypothetical protein